MKTLVEIIDPDLRNMLGAGRIDPEVYEQLTIILETRFSQWAEDVAEELKDKAKEWEEVMGPEKEGFYSLGLRRSADLILGRTDLEEK
jgi:hypothetical protein